MSDTTPDQVWEQSVDGRRHRVEAHGSTRHRVRWLVDGVEVAQRSGLEEKLRLESAEHGRLTVRFSVLGAARRATVGAGATGLDGTDLEPAPGSPAARYEQRVRDHPARYTVMQGLGGVGKVVLAIGGGALAVLALRLLAGLAPDLPLPDLPDLPDLPLPDLPNLPNLPDLPDLPDVRLPDWVRWLLDHASYAVPVVVAVGLAAGEVTRRRTQDERRGSVKPMTIDDITDLVSDLDGVLVQRAAPGDGTPEIVWGDVFVHYAPEGAVPSDRQPFATVVTKDYPGDEASRLDVEGRFRLNVTAGREAFARWTAQAPDAAPDAADVLFAHPVYGSAGWLCVVCPGRRTEGAVRDLLREAYDRARAREERRGGGTVEP